MNTLQLYNPGNQSEQELKQGFSIRIKEFERIFKIIREDAMQNPPQHFIIQGVRGSGKTTLLLRTYYEIKNNTQLNLWLIPIIFNEEQYSVNKLFKFWEKIAAELEQESSGYCGLFNMMQESDEMQNYEEFCYEALFTALKNNKNKICLFIDNIGDILQKLTRKEQQRFREILITNNQIRIIGASATVIEATYKYDEPFYEYFKIIVLNELKSQETKDFLLELDKHNSDNKIQQIIDNKPGRIEALRIISGGIPRTIVLLYEIFISDKNGDSFKDLELLLDRVTPLYKHRMDDLPTQQQEIVDCIALNWDAIPVKEIARKTRMESKAVSAQLNLLEKNNIIIKKTTSTKNHLYQIKERFFNIWYMMRNGQKADKNKVKWLTKFLEVWCDNDSLEEMANSHIAKLKAGEIYDKYAYGLTEAYASIVPSAEKQHELLAETKSYLDSSESELSAKLSKSDIDFISNDIKLLINKGEYLKAIKTLETKESKTGYLDFTKANIYRECLKDFKSAENYYLRAIDKGEVKAMYNLAILYKKEFKDFSKAEKYLLLAYENGLIHALSNLGWLYKNEFNDFSVAEKYYKMATEKGDISAMNNLGSLYFNEIKNYSEAEKYFRLASEKGDLHAICNLGKLFFKFRKNKKEALQLVEKAYNLNYNSEDLNLIYSLVLIWHNKIEKAIEISKPVFNSEIFISKNSVNVETLIKILIAKKQYNLVYKIFEENKYQIKDRLKPIYYALMHFMQDNYPDEIKKMGDELKEPVDKIVRNILEMREKYQ